MGHQVIRMPSGRYGLWSSNVDDFVLINATEQDIVDHFVEEYIRDTRWKIAGIVLMLEHGGKPYYQFTKTWEEALETMDAVHGKDRVTQFIEEFVPDLDTGRGDGKPDTHQQ